VQIATLVQKSTRLTGSFLSELSVEISIRILVFVADDFVAISEDLWISVKEFELCE